MFSALSSAPSDPTSVDPAQFAETARRKSFDRYRRHQPSNPANPCAGPRHKLLAIYWKKTLGKSVLACPTSHFSYASMTYEHSVDALKVESQQARWLRRAISSDGDRSQSGKQSRHAACSSSRMKRDTIGNANGHQLSFRRPCEQVN